MLTEPKTATQVVMRDGTAGNFDLARQYFEIFCRLKRGRSQDFNNLCSRVMLTPYLELAEEHKLTLIDAGLADRNFSEGHIELYRPEAEIKRFLVLTAAEIPLSRLFSRFAKYPGPSYRVVTPFQHPIRRVSAAVNIHDNYNPIVF